MNEGLQKNLARARLNLLLAVEDLARHRRLGCLNSNDRDLLAQSVERRLDAGRRAWDLQCMVEGTFAR